MPNTTGKCKVNIIVLKSLPSMSGNQIFYSFSNNKESAHCIKSLDTDLS